MIDLYNERSKCLPPMNDASVQTLAKRLHACIIHWWRRLRKLVVGLKISPLWKLKYL